MIPSVGAQIWALRNILSLQLEQTLKLLAEAGFVSIEPAGYNVENGWMQGINPKQLKTIAEDYGLKIPGGHFQFLEKDAHKVCETALEMGMTYIVWPTIKRPEKVNIDFYKTIAEEMNRIGAILQSYGLCFAFHNHAWDFEKIEGQLPFDILLENTDKSLVFFQADLAWFVQAGFQPEEYFSKYPNRFPLWHLRDMDLKTGHTTIAGEGSIDFPQIMTHHKTSGLQHAFVEMASGMEQPLEKLIASLNYFKSLRWA